MDSRSLITRILLLIEAYKTLTIFWNLFIYTHSLPLPSYHILYALDHYSTADSLEGLQVLSWSNICLGF